MSTTKTILVIDDETELVEAMSTILLMEGYLVETAFTLAEGKSKITQGKFNLVISDIMMPHWGGFDLIDAIKENPETSSTPVLVVTGMDEDILNATNTFADACLVKPFTGKQLLDKVNELLLKDGTS
jgi:DNA-binding response OmpR family regulator